MGDYEKPTDAVIFDVDGTLADCDHRRHFVEGEKKNFDDFYDAMNADRIKDRIRGLCNMFYMNGFHIIVCTGRPEKYAGVTERWLKEHGVFFHQLMCRPDHRRHEPDYKIKQDMLDFIKQTRDVHLAVDDRNQVVDMWRRNGITCLQCAEGNF